MTQRRFQELPLTDLKPNPANPRSIQTKGATADIQELAASIRARGGVEVPLIVRPNGSGYVIIAGERRYKAAKLARLEVVPCDIREVTDEEAEAITITENLHRKDLHPLQEAEGIARRVDAGQTVEELAAALGVKPSFVRLSLQLRELAPSLKTLFLQADSPISGWSERMLQLAATYPKAAQDHLTQQCGVQWNPRIPRGVRQLREQLEQPGIELSDAPFGADDAELGARACAGCGDNTATHASLFEDLDQEPARCLNRECFGLKRRAWLLSAYELAHAKHGEALVLVSMMHHFDADALPAFGQGILSRSHGFEVVRKKDEGSVPGLVVVRGHEPKPALGALIWILLPEVEETTVGEGSAPAPDSIEAKLERSETLLRRKRLRHAVPALLEAANDAATPSAAKLIRLLACFGGPYNNQHRDNTLPHMWSASLKVGNKHSVPGHVWQVFEAAPDDAAMREHLWRDVQRIIASRLNTERTFDDFDSVDAEARAYARLLGVSWEDLWEAARKVCPPPAALVKRRQLVHAEVD